MYELKKIKIKFDEWKKQKKKGLITFITAGDPNYDASLAILNAPFLKEMSFGISVMGIVPSG